MFGGDAGGGNDLTRRNDMFGKFSALVTLGIAVATMAVQPLHAQKADSGPKRECKTQVVERTGGSARTMVFAHKKARDAWRQKVGRKYGREWTSWLFAKNPEYRCRKVKKGRKVCKILATPCKSLVLVHGPHKNCSFYKIQGTGTKSKLKEWAKHTARKAWAKRVRGFYGKKYDTWLLSNNKETNCKNLKDGSYKCNVIAQPCRFVLAN